MQGAHQVAQNSKTTTFPRKLFQSTFASRGACSIFVNSSSGAGSPGFNSIGGLVCAAADEQSSSNRTKESGKRLLAINPSIKDL